MTSFPPFGTDGIRGVYGKTITPFFSYALGKAIFKLGNIKRLAIGMDNRQSGPPLMLTLAQGFGEKVENYGPLTTPAFSSILRKGNYDLGIMITASHNGPEYNGFKLLNPDGSKIDVKLEKQISSLLEIETNPSGPIHLKEKDFFDIYRAGFVSFKTKGKYVFDLASGASQFVVPGICALLGIDATYIGLGEGKTINQGCGCLHMENLAKAMATGNYDLGFSFDGDGDRVLAMDKEGHILDGDDFLYLFALSFKQNHRLKGNAVVSTIYSNSFLKEALKEEGIDCFEADVGDHSVYLKLKENDFLLGGENSGHIIVMDELPSGDGLANALRLIDIYENKSAVFEKFKALSHTPRSERDVYFVDANKAKEAYESISFAKAIKEGQAKIEGKGKLVTRLSGTEPLIRVFVESQDKVKNDTIVSDIVSSLKES